MRHTAARWCTLKCTFLNRQRLCFETVFVLQNFQPNNFYSLQTSFVAFSFDHQLFYYINHFYMFERRTIATRQTKITTFTRSGTGLTRCFFLRDDLTLEMEIYGLQEDARARKSKVLESTTPGRSRVLRPKASDCPISCLAGFRIICSLGTRVILLWLIFFICMSDLAIEISSG
jgi:hypothetical protein